MNVIEVTTAEEIQDSFTVRERVFIKEQGVDPAIEHDKFDEEAIHIVGYLENKPIAVARIRIIDGKGKIQRVAILKEYRNRGYGKQLMLEIEQIILKHKVRHFYLNAQTHAVPFYQTIGYEISSSPFFEAGIEHVQMDKRID